jgi:hypothetical protein
VLYVPESIYFGDPANEVFPPHACFNITSQFIEAYIALHTNYMSGGLWQNFKLSGPVN